jgi:hypothetical protein
MANWSDVRILNAGQAAKLEEFRVIGANVNNRLPADISGVTDNQAKQGINFLNTEMRQLFVDTEAGLRYVREVFRNNAIKTYDDGVIPGP